MRPRPFCILFLLFLVLQSDLCHAGAMLYMIQQKKRMQQQAQQQQYQQYLAQQQGQPQANQPSQQLTPAQAYQQTVDQRNQAIAQDILSTSSQTTLQQVAFGNNPDAAAPDGVVSSSLPAMPQAYSPAASQQETTVDLSDVWKKLDTKSTVWAILEDDQAKVLTVSEYINRLQAEGVKISEPPEHYVQMIDQMSKQNPSMLDRPFGELIKILAIMDYDFDNGMNKDDLARKVLGESAYEANKQRFAQQKQ